MMSKKCEHFVESLEIDLSSLHDYEQLAFLCSFLDTVSIAPSSILSVGSHYSLTAILSRNSNISILCLWHL
jgi:hypothetical protein